MKVFFLTVFPILTLVVYLFGSVLCFMRLEYQNIFQIIYKTTYNTSTINRERSITFLLTRFFIQFLVLFYIFFFKLLVINTTEVKLFYINNLIYTQLHIYTIMFYLFLTLIITHRLFVTRHTADLLIFLISVYLFAFSILCSNNLLTIFLNLEVINVFVMYSFIILLHNTYLLDHDFTSRNLWVVSLCMYQFILNFFSSILFFFVFNMLTIKTYSTNFLFLSNFDVLSHSFSIYLFGLYLSFFIKLGVGPWVFFKIEIYQTFNWFLLVFYTFLYFSIILVFFINLFTVYFLPLTTLFNSALVFITLSVVCYFSLFLFNYFNFFVFFSFSSLLNMAFIIVQLLFIMTALNF